MTVVIVVYYYSGSVCQFAFTHTHRRTRGVGLHRYNII